MVMAARVSRGCLRCRTRRVKCDEGRPSCRRCIQRDEVCEGYRDDATLLFRSENDKVARRVMTRQSSDHDLRGSSTSSRVSATSSQSSFGTSKLSYGSSTASSSSLLRPLVNNHNAASSVLHSVSATDSSEVPNPADSSIKLSAPYPWAKATPESALPSAEDAAVEQFFEKYVMYPCNQGSSPGFLEHLPSLFREPRAEGRLALRWAVRAAAYASLSNDQDNTALGNKALQCYGRSLTALADALKKGEKSPDDYVLMTIVVLDMFETVYLRDTGAVGSHAEGMAQILRLRGPDQIYGARGWSLFRLSHHRIQKQQLVSKMPLLPESDSWLDSLNEKVTEIRIEKDNHEITKVCARGKELLQMLNESGKEASSNEILGMIRELHELDHNSTTWRAGPDWAYKTIHRSEIVHSGEASFFLPEFVQLHRDVWIAYEWNYHRTARVILHETLLRCLEQLETMYPEQQGALPVDSASLKEASISTIQFLVDEVISTVPQMLGDIDHEGNIMGEELGAKICKGIGGYFLLWPIRITKSTKYALPDQTIIAQAVFDRIRECTGMKSALGDASCIVR